MPLILSGNVASATAAAYTVANSCRFNDDDSAYMHKTPSSSGSQRTFTFSTWWKQGDLASTSIIFSSGGGGPNFAIYYDGSQQFNVLYYEGSTLLQLITNAVYRDPSAWYHICVAIDTTQSTDTNRAKIYINGSQVTSLATETYCNQNVDISINTSSYRMAIGAGVSDGDIADGYAAETVLIDGQQLTPTSFGEFDSASPTIWKPIDVSGLTFGTNGFYLDFEDSANLGNDANGGTDLTEVNLAAADQATDTPTNNFCTLNPLWKESTSAGAITYSEGNTTYQATTNGNSYTRGTVGISSGKWYMEMKVTEVNTGQSSSMTITPDNNYGAADSSSSYGFQVQLNSSNTVLNKFVTGTWTEINASFSSGSIAMLAIDLDNGKMWVGYDGTWYNDNNASTTFDTNNPDATGIPTTIGYLVGFQAYWQTGGYYNTANANFGSPSYTISSANSDANGYGNFEYAPPSGYYALCTKNLAEYG